MAAKDIQWQKHQVVSHNQGETLFRAVNNKRIPGLYFLTFLVLLALRTIIAPIDVQEKTCSVSPFSATSKESKILFTAAR